MSKTAFEKYENARSTQLQSNEARKMRALIQQARAGIQRSGSRWPFELAQNAHDPGPRSEGCKINLSLRHEDQELVFSHNGKPFSTSDLAALLSGGSSKEFDSEETTGRFGTGFLLTHVLSCEIAIEGILDLDGTYERFAIELNRSGTEEEIFKNTTQCSTAIERAEPLLEIDGHETAKFTYRLDSQEAAKQGVEAFVETLPYLYATCPHLGVVDIVSSDGRFCFSPQDLTIRRLGDVMILSQNVTIEQVGSEARAMRSVILRRSQDALSGLVILLERIGERWVVVQVPTDFPRIFVRFPIRSSEFLPVNVIIDGRFGLFQERDSVLMEDHDRDQITEALNLLPDLLKVSLEEDWKNGFTLARVGMPEQQFGDKLSERDEEWWRSTLGSVATQLALMPIVRAEDGSLHKISNEGSCADFVALRLNSTDPLDEDCLNFNDVWQSASETVRALPPALAIARQWTIITWEWSKLGVSSQRLALADIAALARGTTGKLGDLQTKPPQLEWLARFLNLVGKLAATHNCALILKDLLPSQTEVLKSPAALWRDAGIDERLKDIADSIGLGVRSRLLMKDLEKTTKDPALVDAQGLLDTVIPNSLTNEAILDECIGELSKLLIDGNEISPDDVVYRKASIDLLRFLWDSRGKKASDLARLCPLISSAGTSIRYSSPRRLMAPVSHWHLDAQEFSKVYKADRVLAEDYMTVVPGASDLVSALSAWEMVYPDPLLVEDIKELRHDKLKFLAEGEVDPDAVINDLRASRIAFLTSELIQRCSVDTEVAKSLLGLVICHVARHDDLWNHPLPVVDRRNEVDFPLTVRPAVWIADLKARAWVPVRSEKGLAPVIADAGNLVQLLEPRWLENNEPGIRLLCEFFGFKDLELQLLAKAPTEELRAEMENGLARIVQTLGSDAAAYGVLATVVEADKKRADEKERNKKFGLAVQEAIRRCLSAHQLDLVLIDSGYDYDVFLDSGDSVDAGTHHLKVADYLLEVKATTTGDVRLTPAQARTAAEDRSRFILCVVDLRGIDSTRMAEDWTEADVEPRTKIFRGVGDLTQHPSEIVEEAKQCSVGIRNDGALRYSVPVGIWDEGIPISSWVESLR